jgi:predicted nuclease of restriction endonuclease-like RecB superfamily
MLSPELVRTRRRGGELTLVALSGKQRQRAQELGEALIAVTRQHVGRSREELERSLRAIPVTASEKKLLAGLAKLVEDACEFSSPAGVDARALRSRVFAEASALRSRLEPGQAFDRQVVLGKLSEELGLSAGDIEAALFADLRGSHLLLGMKPLDAAELVARYERAGRQAVLLRAVKVRADIRCSSPAEYRALFHKLKFRRLLYELHPLSPDGYRVEIDGPFSVFEAVTKYGLQLALMLPALEACQKLSLNAQVLWGKQREPLAYRFELEAERRPGRGERPALPDEVARLVEGLSALESPWSVRESRAILDLPGVGLCVPDLEFEHADTGEVLFLEVLGYWSRDAVWRRVELVERGLSERILFAVSSRLRVSEAVLDESEMGALYVYKSSMNPRAVLTRLEQLRRRPGK